MISDLLIKSLNEYPVAFRKASVLTSHNKQSGSAIRSFLVFWLLPEINSLSYSIFPVSQTISLVCDYNCKIFYINFNELNNKLTSTRLP